MFNVLIMLAVLILPQVGRRANREGTMMTNAIRTLVLLLTIISPACVHAGVMIFNDFNDTSTLTLNGDAAVANTSDGAVLRLTPALTSKSGSAFSSVTVNAATFSTAFTFRITNPGGPLFDGNSESGADGLVFVAQSVSSAIGGFGQGIGYAGISNSVGVEFDTWHNSVNNDPNSNHLGIDIAGNVNHGPGSPHTLNVAPNFDDGNIWYAWVDYDGSDIEVRANQTGIRPLAASLSRTLDLPAILGQGDAYVGFTSGTGSDWGNHDILSWTYRDSFDPVGGAVPEPTSMAIYVLGLCTLAVGRRRRFSEAKGSGR